jgi:hypothetical protein
VNRRAAFATPPGAVAVLGLVLALVAGGCARKLAPSGGPRDLSAPALLAAEPDSGAAGIDTLATIRLTFSEPMDRASVEGGLLVAPGVRSGRFAWEGGRTLSFRPDRPLAADRTYVVLLAAGARDVRGNVLNRPFVAHFSTAAAFAPGTIEGRVEGRGLTPDGVFVWAYRADLGREPDSTSLDMDALAQARGGGLFRLAGLAVPGTYRLWAFVDRNRNRTFEPAADLLLRSDSLVALSSALASAREVRLVALDPEALARVEGAVVDSLSPGIAALRVEIRGVPASGEAADRAPVNVIDVRQGQFVASLRAGRWRLVAWRDLDDDRVLAASEPQSPAIEVDLEAAGVSSGHVLVLAPVPGASP